MKARSRVRKAGALAVADVMTADAATCRATDSLNRAAQLMWERRCGCLPIVDEQGTPVGIVTDRDVCMAAYTQGRRLDDIVAATAMSQPVRTCLASTPLEEAVTTMMVHAIRRLVVTDADGSVRGIISLEDVARHGALWDGKGEIDLEQVAVALGEIARRTTRTEEDSPGGPGAATEAMAFIESSLAALATLRREIRTDLRLAGENARARWRRLETRLRSAEEHARNARRDAAENLSGLLEVARRFRTQLREDTAAASQAR